jgi:hypothetical protein
VAPRAALTWHHVMHQRGTTCLAYLSVELVGCCVDFRADVVHVVQMLCELDGRC